MRKLFYSTQTCATAVRIALEEAGLEYEGVEVSWYRKLNVEALNQVNPLGQVPALVENGKVLIQMPAVLEYVGDLARSHHLISPVGTWGRNETNAWLSFLASDLQGSFRLLGRAHRGLKSEAAKEEVVALGREEISKHLGYVNAALKGKEYLVADHYTVADIYCFTLIGWCKWAGVNVAEHENLVPFVKRILARPAVQKILKEEDLLDFLPS